MQQQARVGKLGGTAPLTNLMTVYAFSRGMFSQKLQHIGDKYHMFRIGSIPGNQITAFEFH